MNTNNGDVVATKEVVATTGASDTKVRTNIVSVNIRKNADGNNLYIMELGDNVPCVDGQRNYVWFTPSKLRSNLIAAEPDFDIVLGKYVKSDVAAGIEEQLPLTEAQAKAYLVSATIGIDCHFVAAGEVVTYGDNEYTYEHDTYVYTLVSIELAPKAQRRLDNKIDSLL